MQHMIDLTHVC